jgi:hypothetical protein
MVDFSKLLRAPAGAAKPPQALPVGDYQGVVKAWRMVEAPKDKEYTAMIRFTFGLVEWPSDIDEEDKMQDTASGPQLIELGKRQLTRDFYDNRLDILDGFLNSLGVQLSGKSYEEVLPETIGAPCVVPVQQYTNQRTGELGNQVGNPRGLE